MKTLNYLHRKFECITTHCNCSEEAKERTFTCLAIGDGPEDASYKRRTYVVRAIDSAHADRIVRNRLWPFGSCQIFINLELD